MLDAVQMGKKLTKLRGNRTQAEVAKALNISVSSIAMYEAGNRVPRDEVKVSLARYYETTVETLFFAQ